MDRNIRIEGIFEEKKLKSHMAASFVEVKANLRNFAALMVMVIGMVNNK